MDRSSSIRTEKLLGSTELPDSLLNKTLLPVSLDIAGIVSVRREVYIIIIYTVQFLMKMNAWPMFVQSQNSIACISASGTKLLDAFKSFVI